MTVSNSGPRRRRWQVFDSPALAAAVRDATVASAGQVGRSQRAIAKSIGISQPVLSRVLAGKASELLPRTARALMKLPGLHDDPRFMNALIPPGAHAVTRLYEEWQKAEATRMTAMWQWEGTEDKAENLIYGPRLSRHRISELRAVIGRVLTLLHCRRVLRDFVATTNSWGHDESLRQALALIRVVEPLLDARNSGFIERDWRELPDDEFLQFVEAGIVRETILLHRSPPGFRMQEAVNALHACEASSLSHDVDTLADPRSLPKRAPGAIWKLISAAIQIVQREQPINTSDGGTPANIIVAYDLALATDDE